MTAFHKIHPSSDRNVYLHNYRSGERKCCCLEFGKVKYWSNKRTNELTLYVALTDDGMLSIMGDIWNATHTDTVTCGQIFETVFAVKNQLSENAKIIVNKILWLWCNYHLQKKLPENVISAVRKLQEIEGELFEKPVDQEVLNALSEIKEWPYDKVPEYLPFVAKDDGEK